MTEPGKRSSDAERWREVEEILGRALECDPRARPELLESACGGDDELRREVEELLEAEAAAPTFLDDGAAGFAAEALSEPESELPGLAVGSEIGEYRLIEPIGAGGMSRVFLAERTRGDFKQRVAIKVLRAVGLDAEQGLERFRFERMILASLDHPHIAKILDGGASEAGLPYLVMEYVEGRSIVDYCARNELGLDARLELARDVCEAVQYAHQRLIVHRDLKPSNILVTDDGQVKLLDFGIAKLLDPDALEIGATTPLTRTGLLLMTPDYAAPEQVSGDEITTASDVYALGVLLYELLSGQKPYETQGKSPATVERLICELDPPPPSSAPAPSHMSAAVLGWRDELRGDLDAVVAKAMRKEPEHRYASAHELGADLESYSQGLPVSAGPTTFGYRARKFVRRNRLPVAAASLLIAALMAFGAVMTWQQAQTRKERDRARAAEAKASAINRFLVDDLLAAAGPEVAQGREITVQSVVKRAEERVEGSFASEPTLEASVRRALGEIHLGLGELEAASEQILRAEALFRQELGSESAETLETRSLMAELALAQDDPEQALAILGELLDVQRRVLGEGDLTVRETEGILGHALIETADLSAAVERLTTTAEALEREAPGAWRERLPIYTLLGRAYASQRRWLEAEEAAAVALRLQLQHLGPNHPDLGMALAGLGRVQTKLDRFEEAEETLLKALDLQQRVIGASHPDTIATLRLLAVLHWDREDVATATSYAQQEYDQAVIAFGKDHPRTVRSLAALGIMHERNGRTDLAEPILRQLIEVNVATMGASHPRSQRAMKNLNKLLLRAGKVDEARAAIQRAIAAGWEGVEERSDDPTYLSDFAWVLATYRPEDVRDPEGALPLAERAVELGERQWDDALDTLAHVYHALGRLDDAIATEREALLQPDAIRSGTYEHYLMELLEEKGDLAAAEEMLLDVQARRRVALAPDDPSIGSSYRRLARVRARMGRIAEAESDLRAAIAQFEKTLGPEDLRVWRAKSELGGVLVLAGKFEEAEEVLLAAAETARPHAFFRVDAIAREDAFERLVDLYSTWGRPERAAAWREELERHRAW